MLTLLKAYLIIFTSILLFASCNGDDEIECDPLDYLTVCPSFDLVSDLENSEVKIGDPIEISILIPEEVVNDCDGQALIISDKLKLHVPLIFNEFVDDMSLQNLPPALSDFTYNITNGQVYIDQTIDEEAIVIYPTDLGKEINITVRPNKLGIFLIHADFAIREINNTKVFAGDPCRYEERIKIRNIEASNKELLTVNSFNHSLEDYVDRYGLLAFKVVD